HQLHHPKEWVKYEYINFRVRISQVPLSFTPTTHHLSLFFFFFFFFYMVVIAFLSGATTLSSSAKLLT
ncbi:hypothetical protein BC941DRAFT_360807, partial [Chlamydoabsidia padenii]